jgi:hypothetical protein
VDGCAAGNEVEDGCGDEFVGENQIGGEDGFVCCAGKEVGVARAGTCEDDTTCSSSRSGGSWPDFRGDTAGEFAE